MDANLVKVVVAISAFEVKDWKHKNLINDPGGLIAMETSEKSNVVLKKIKLEILTAFERAEFITPFDRRLVEWLILSSPDANDAALERDGNKVTEQGSSSVGKSIGLALQNLDRLIQIRFQCINLERQVLNQNLQECLDELMLQYNDEKRLKLSGGIATRLLSVSSMLKLDLASTLDRLDEQNLKKIFSEIYLSEAQEKSAQAEVQRLAHELEQIEPMMRDAAIDIVRSGASYAAQNTPDTEVLDHLYRRGAHFFKEFCIHYMRGCTMMSALVGTDISPVALEKNIYALSSGNGRHFAKLLSDMEIHVRKLAAVYNVITDGQRRKELFVSYQAAAVGEKKDHFFSSKVEASVATIFTHSSSLRLKFPKEIEGMQVLQVDSVRAIILLALSKENPTADEFLACKVTSPKGTVDNAHFVCSPSALMGQTTGLTSFRREKLDGEWTFEFSKKFASGREVSGLKDAIFKLECIGIPNDTLQKVITEIAKIERYTHFPDSAIKELAGDVTTYDHDISPLDKRKSYSLRSPKFAPEFPRFDGQIVADENLSRKSILGDLERVLTLLKSGKMPEPTRSDLGE